MRKQLIPVICVLAVICLASGIASGTNGEQNAPKLIMQSSKAIVKLRIDNKGCSGIRVADDLILTAAHGLYDYDANYKPKRIVLLLRGRQYQLDVAESGQFRPERRQVGDWALLRPRLGIRAFHGVAVANLATSKTMERILKELGDFTGKQPGTAIWSASYPMFTIRPYPISGADGKSIFFSRGHMRSDTAYKKHIIFTAYKSQFYDDHLTASPPQFHTNISKAWAGLKHHPILKGIYLLYEQYEDDGDPILYHTADYSNGSSGGGFFDEETGELIGIVAMGTHMGPRYNVHYGIGDLYRIDIVCRQSSILSGSGLCQNN